MVAEDRPDRDNSVSGLTSSSAPEYLLGGMVAISRGNALVSADAAKLVLGFSVGVAVYSLSF